MPRVSVCIASFNHEKYVRAAIESVLAQSFDDYEILVTDDGSPDGTVDEIRLIKDKRVSLEVFQQNRGACLAKNACLRRSKGEYIANLNSDDLFLPGKLERQVRFLDDHPETAAVFGRPMFIDETGKQLADSETFFARLFAVENKTRPQWLRHFFLIGNCLCHPTVLIRRRCYDEVGYYDPTFAQLPDLDMWVRLVERHEIHLMNEPLIGFRILANDANASAPRPGAIMRHTWEWRRILEHYTRMDERQLVEVFPELAGRVESTAQPSWVSKMAYEMLERYLYRQDARASAEGRATAKQRPALWCLAELALELGTSPAHVTFALDTMYRVLAGSDAAASHPELYREFIAHTGNYDPWGLLGGANRKLA